MESALSWTLTNANHPSFTVLFCTDSKSSCEALISLYPRTFSIRNSISSISSSIFIQWIPGHSSIPGNDSQTKQPKKLLSLPQTQLVPSLYLASFESSTKQFVTLHQHTNGLLLSTNFKVFLETSNRLPTEKMTFLLLSYDPVTTLL